MNLVPCGGPFFGLFAGAVQKKNQMKGTVILSNKVTLKDEITIFRGSVSSFKDMDCFMEGCYFILAVLVISAIQCKIRAWQFIFFSNIR
jgi:hypothetical protein